MKLKLLIAFRTSKRLTLKARFYRCALRHHLRKEFARVRNLETRSRGLRLYAAWASGVSNVIQTRAENWYQATVAKAAREISPRTPAA